MTDEEKEKVREATDIVSLVGETVELRRRGHDWWGRCPFHQDKTASFHVIPSSGFWKCFGCGKGGDVFSYVMERDGVDFMDAARILADRANIELTERGASPGPRVGRNRLVECLDSSVSFYHTQLMRGRSDAAAAARAYLAGRAFNAEVCRRWRIGFAPGHGQLVGHLARAGFTTVEMTECDVASNYHGRARDVFYDRVMFPIEDERGRTVAFGGRVYPGSPSEGSEYNQAKYRNSRETKLFSKSKHLFALNRAKEHIVATGDAVVVEGYCDAITMHEAGFPNVVATLGTALTASHVKTLTRFAKRIVCMFDGDRAGQAAAEHAVRFVAQTPAQLMAVVLPDNLDPDEFINQRGADALRAAIEGLSQPLIDFVFDKKLRDLDLSTPGKRLAALDEMASVFAPLKQSVLLDAYATRIADALSVDSAAVKQKIRAAPIPADDEGGGPSRRRPTQPFAPRDDVPPYDDYVPSDEYGPVPVQAPPDVFEPELGYLSADDRSQVTLERELLALLAASPAVFRGQEERLGALSWTDERHEAIAWAILSMPPGSTQAQVAEMVTAVSPDAPAILASARYVGSDLAPDEAKAAFLLDTVDYHSCRKRLRQTRSRLEGASGEAAKGLMAEGATLRRREQELLRAIEADRLAMATARGASS